jgi:hypothetical protein
MEPSELKNLLQDLINDKIDGQCALATIFSNKKKAWQTSYWKQKRNSILKDTCEKCGSNKDLLIQHSWHPILHPLSRFIEWDTNPVQLININIKNIEAIVDKEGVKRDCCPVCKSVNIYKLKSIKDKWKCKFKRTRYGRIIEICGHEFDLPDKTIYYKSVQCADKNIAISERMKVERDKALRDLIKDTVRENESFLRKEQAIDFIAQCIEYVCLDSGVSTFCKKCAFKDDYHLIISKQIKQS